MSFDPPGTWESPGDIGLYTMTNYLKAVDEVINYYGNKQTFVMGHSRGGTIAMLAGTTNPHITDYVAIMSSFTKDGFKEKKDDNWKEKGLIVSARDLPPGGGPNEKQFKLPYSFFEDQNKYFMTEELKKSTKPKLFILGKQDSLVLPKTVRETYGLLSESKELYELDSDHDYRNNDKLIQEVNVVVGNFLRKFNQ